ncbi:MAG: polyprenyl synthetase family protein [Clostridia bacterium]|nr:polyprenyl synthetase family protein [Clostridia bacterium]
MNIIEDLKAYNTVINGELDSLLSGKDDDLNLIADSMRYSVQNGGKRIRPYLVLKFSELGGLDSFNKGALAFACALEMIHTYSLIHDDLPCMDNDDLRRGKPTNHKVFGEATATLAGDALLTLAFEVVSAAETTDKAKIKAVNALSELAGWKGMVGGQIMDLEGEKRKLTDREFTKMNALKTGALLRCTARLGLAAAVCDDEQTCKDADEYCACIGRAFQIRDDILDVTANQAELGKPVGSDAKNGKTTVLSYMSLDKAQALAAELTEKAAAAIEKYGKTGKELSEFAVFLLNRRK